LLKFGADKFLLGADVRDEKITINGWQESTSVWIYDFIGKFMSHGVKQMFCTDVSKDGLLAGPSIELYKNIISKYPDLRLIASGGVSSIHDMEMLKEIGCKGAIIGKAIYEGRIEVIDLQRFNAL
jgi:phosphoribosylformimino-5-aminoimidazole carboxamide ribotide isomerase